MVLHLTACLDPFCQTAHPMTTFHLVIFTSRTSYSYEMLWNRTCFLFLWAFCCICCCVWTNTRPAAHDTQTMAAKCFSYSTHTWSAQRLGCYSCHSWTISVNVFLLFSVCQLFYRAARSLEMSHCSDVGYFVDFLNICRNCIDLFDNGHLFNPIFLSSLYPLRSFL